MFNSIPEKLELNVTADFVKTWDKISEIRVEVQKALELARKDKVIGSSLEACVTLHCNADLYDFVVNVHGDLKDVFIVSQVDLEKNCTGDYVAESLEGLSVTISRAVGKKCERCWSFSDTVGKNSNDENICSRCASILIE
jgi:isoleucyl-tRNA synthetase